MSAHNPSADKHQMLFKSQLTLALQVGQKVSSVGTCVVCPGRNLGLPVWDKRASFSVPRVCPPSKAPETKTDRECPPSRPPVQTQIKTDAPPGDVAERRQRGEVGKASEEWQESRGKERSRDGEGGGALAGDREPGASGVGRPAPARIGINTGAFVRFCFRDTLARGRTGVSEH